MPIISFPDGNKREFDKPVSGTELLKALPSSVAKKAVALEVDGKIFDLTHTINKDASIRFITRQDQEALELIRHDAAHVMAEAVQSLWPGTQVTIGPSIKDGFYYDFYRDTPFSTEDLEKIEKKMVEIIRKNNAFTREEWPREEAVKHFTSIGEKFKTELINDLPDSEIISIYKQGEWLDLCRGPHMRSTGDIGEGFKLTRVAGAYWRGDHNNPMLTRIYGTAWRDKKELNAYLETLEEAAKRDHRKLGRDMDLFHVQDEAAGQIFWHEKGWRLYCALQDYMRRIQNAAGYHEVKTPQLLDRTFWEKSGHWDKYRENMYVCTSEDEKVLALKPMNCPCHVEIFRHDLRSYRDLPLRMAEFGACNRYEPSGSLHGIMRVRGFTQDDAHIFCTEEQISAETKDFVKLTELVYKDLGFDKFFVRFSDRPEKRAGSDETWDKAEAALKKACEEAGVETVLNPGEGAFYGPKLEFVLTDALGREWQCGTLQVDYVLPERLNATYIGSDSSRHTPVMLHRAILGSFERFIGILIEQYAGKFPFWLAPQQVVVTSIVSDVEEYAARINDLCVKNGLSSKLDNRTDKINAKIREHSLARVPVLLIAGRKEAEEGTVTIRRLGHQDQVTMKYEDAVKMLAEEATPPDIRRTSNS